MMGNKSSLLDDKIDPSMLTKQVLYDEELYINNIWCKYYLSYYPVNNKFVEKIYFVVQNIVILLICKLINYELKMRNIYEKNIYY